MQKILDDVYLFEDTCNVYVVRRGDHAVLVDFGAGDVLDHLSELGVVTVDAVLLTHHHRDQGQGLPRAVAREIPIYVPYSEQDLFHGIDTHWQERELYCNYNMRQDRFSILHAVPITGTLLDYAAQTFGDLCFDVVPTPGHTTGSITLMIAVNDKRVAFTGDLIAGPGKVWSMAATQWSYNGAEGVTYTMTSLLDLKQRQPDMLLPSHGDPMRAPATAIDMLVDRLGELLRLRGQHLSLLEVRAQPYQEITPHLLRHMASTANCYVLLSESGKAMFIDFGYDMESGMASGRDRASRRPWLYTIPWLKKKYRLSKIDVVMPTHFHDDHVAGINLLRRVEGTQVWAADLFADILENPAHFDLPCLWYDPIHVDRRMPLEEPIQWEEYTFHLWSLPGHTFYAVAIEFEVDGKRVLATGDQYQGGEGLQVNYVYPNRFNAGDYVKNAELYNHVNPDLIITGHNRPLWVTQEYLDKLQPLGEELERLHRVLQPQTPDLGQEGFIARLTPYQSHGAPEDTLEFQVEIHNPFRRSVTATVVPVVPDGWRVVDEVPPLRLLPASDSYATFHVVLPSSFHARRERIAVDVTIDGHRFGQQAEAVVSAAGIRRPYTLEMP